MFRILESQAPAKQTATDTIDVLSSRLQNATLLEDRRAAIQGLRSFAKIYPASVASGGLRSLISSLRNDQEDVDTTKVVLETLLMLFTPDETSPEASDEIALWLADEFTQRQDNITILLDLLETREFYSRLYSLQLMSHICSARPERTQECIFTAPLGISKLVSVLTDIREPVRNEGLVLLIALTPSSEELQKLVAFENTFEIIFSLIDTEGSMIHGTEVVEDCLSLLANLLRFNVSNQSFFRETGCAKKVTKLLIDCQQEDDEPPAQWTLLQRDKNVWGLLAIIQLFLVRGGMSTPINQTAFWQNGVTEQVLSIAFGQKFSVNVTAKALSTCADLIRGNSPLQERFGDIEVIWGSVPHDPTVNGNAAEPERINVIEAFLKLSLQPSPNNMLDARLAACECMKAFFAQHTGIRMHVLRRAIDGHLSGQDRIPNIMSVLLTAPESRGNADPYQVWMACVLMFHLISDDEEAKATAMKVTEGDAESGEEVVTSVQSVVGNLITGLQRGDDERITVGYLMLLCGWLFEDPDVVNDLLGEGSSIQTLLQEIKHQRVPSKLIPGLCTVLLGIIYEFSTKDSPIPRVTLHKLLLEQLGREQYIDKITKLRECPWSGTLRFFLRRQLVFFDRSFVEFLKDNFSRFIRAIDREPGFEISVMANGVEKGVSRELVDSLRAELDDRSQSLQKLESDLVSIQRRLDQEQLDHRKTKESTSAEMSKAQQGTQSLLQSHEQAMSKLDEQHKASKNELLKQHGEQLRGLGRLRKKSAKVKAHHDQEVAGLQKTIRQLESELSKAREQHAGEVASLQQGRRNLEFQLSKVQEQHAGDVAGLKKTIHELESTASQFKEGHAGEISDLTQKLQSLDSTLGSTRAQHDTEIAGFKTTIENLESDLAAVEAVKDQHEKDVASSESKIKSLESDLSAAKGRNQKHEAEVVGFKTAIGDLESQMAAAEGQHTSKTAELKKSMEILQADLAKSQEQSGKDKETASEGFKSKYSELEARAAEAERKVKEAESQAHNAADALKKIQAQLEKAQSEAKEKDEARQATQTELDDLLIQRLKDLGQEVSEDEDEDDDEE
ncbi:Armadillo-like helical [Penicillium atrosanguineum]|nr:Armadillo-like helical [Penicillium atrosanguineum]